MVTFRRPRTKPQDNELAVWSNGERVGTWYLSDGEHRFQYQADWLQSAAGRPVSLSMPFVPGNLPHRGQVVHNYFDNLLPDSDAIRRRLRDKFATGSTAAFDLLSAIGRDCVGAVQLLAPGIAPEGFDRIDAVPLDEVGVEQAINNAVTAGRVLGFQDEDDFRISIAGAQEKTALLWHNGQWCRPLNATPTTHIFKLPLGLVGNVRADMHESVENEWLCAQILGLLGLPVAACDIATFGKRKVLVVERFDRALETPPGRTPWLARLPQEDFCQALGVAGDMKYESDGGPGVRAILRQLDNSSQANADKLVFVKTLLAFWIMAATDGHAKNFSIFLERGGGYRMTPLYDVLSAWPIIGNGPNQVSPRRAKLAMALRSKNAHYNLQEIHTRHWQTLAQQSGVPNAFDSMVALVLQVPGALERAEALLPKGFPAKVFKAIRAGMLAQARRFTDEMT
ncbi:MAG: type II toxin-antitoxin system HipA family toxin [Polaromonas sp.]|uniref:type II toxin-antitoxin system HipA family toxin n=1 Tax=Polaromonas sp. TaxID=1869339 RepID=UPI0025CCA68E|nr:type II toxin-antitoxin system HipA family toxin [Polaromonas sp.]MBI2724813.1 type II toxin-antitoxin system HipA family toxin [Polaromonas sp.]